MGWLIFAGWLILGLFANVFLTLSKHCEPGTKEKKLADRGRDWCLWIGLTIMIIGLLYLLGWIWYYFCSGFLIFEDQPFFDKIICGLISLIPLGFLLGFIAICCGWDPFKK